MQNQNLIQTNNNDTEFFYKLTPEIILNSIESHGFLCTGFTIALNSMENRVYQIEIEVDSSKIKSPHEKYLIAKFYRPGRWSYEQIKEEHDFMFDLKNHDIPVVAPLIFDGESIFRVKDTNIFYTIFPKMAGRMPEEFNDKNLRKIGTHLAYLHNLGSKRKLEHRMKLDPASYGENNLNYLLEKKVIPIQFEKKYEIIASQIINNIKPLFEKTYYQRIHGDFHRGNLLFNNDEVLFIDFDDMLEGPPVQDFWLITPGRANDEFTKKEREILISSYDVMREFDFDSLKLIEPLRTLRMIHFTTWIAKRWEDPIFQRTFPHFVSEKFWNEEIQALYEQLEILQNC